MDKSSLNMPKIVNFWRVFETATCGQAVLPDISILIRQKLMENGKIEKLKRDNLRDFNTFSNTPSSVKTF